jgi:imidazolonepropionase
LIADFGSMDHLPKPKQKNYRCNGKMIFPVLVRQPYIVYAGNREQEFVDRINGLSYEEIANRGGGILTSSTKLTEEEIYNQSKERLEEVAFRNWSNRN